MKFSKAQIAIAAGAGFLVLLGFFIYLMWLNGQPPVLAKSLEVDPLTKVPLSIDLNPLRDRTSERSANEFLRAMRDGHCNEQLADWEKDYRKRYAAFICDSEAKHPLASWRIVDWEDRPPLRILHYSGILMAVSKLSQRPAVLGKVLRAGNERRAPPELPNRLYYLCLPNALIRGHQRDAVDYGSGCDQPIGRIFGIV